MKKTRLSIIICLVMLLTNLLSVTVYSATADQKAITAYKQKLKAIKKNDMRSSDRIAYKYVDLDGNGIRELLCEYYHKKYDPGDEIITYRIYTYSKGKVICQFNFSTSQCAPSQLRYSRTSKAFRTYGGVTNRYSYYKLKAGKYVCVGYKEGYNSKWRYYVNGIKVSKATYEKSVAGTQKGTCKSYNLRAWGPFRDSSWKWWS